MRTIRFGVSRSHGGAQLVEGTRRFSSLLAERLRQPVRTIITNDYDHLLEGVLVAGIDVGWMPPLVHARAVEREGLLACVSQRGGAVNYRAALLVRVDSDYQKPTDLKGARAAWTDRVSASGYLFPRLHLLASGLDPASDLEESLVGSATAAMAAVSDDKADVCACFVSDAAGEDRERAIADVSRSFPPAAWRLRVLGITDSIPPDGLVLAPSLEGVVQAQLRDRFLTLHQDAAGATALAELFGADRFVPVTANVSRAIERLRQLAKSHL